MVALHLAETMPGIVTRLTAAERYGVLPMPSRAWTPDVERATAHI